MLSISIIIPTFNEAGNISMTLDNISKFVEQGHECIVVDGGSSDATASICSAYQVTFLHSEKGRATQLNYGASHASNAVLVFLHADSLLPDCTVMEINKQLDNKTSWGRFNVKFTGKHFILGVIAALMNIRSCLTGIATGDQAMFVFKDIFESVHGFPEIPLMEDIALSKALKQYSAPACIKQAVITSSRRWETNGYIKTILLMWKIRLLYFFGVPADKLAKMYH